MDRRIYSITGEMVEYGGGISPFGGYFLLNPESYSIFGHIGDNVGVANIQGNFDSNDSLTFFKNYEGKVERGDYEFNFNSEKGIWFGKYNAPIDSNNVGSGRAVCQIFPTKFCLPSYPQGIAGISSEGSWDRIIDGMIEDSVIVPANFQE